MSSLKMMEEAAKVVMDGYSNASTYFRNQIRCSIRPLKGSLHELRVGDEAAMLA
jgi:hypothetical protein